ncbi:WXG100 family type VII secretion target [Nocardia sp. BMG111209]|uniref:WXG100 family type VII secretion target n=1 Tax=Nocardia sp. BMG111209 TaxID=1160137 RepID=UPI00037615CF|nr:WXG100 family type VII secretion target [Nocardia sp. BMG111209]
MSADYRVDLDRLQQLIDDTAKLESAIESTAADLDDRIDRLHVQWTGAGAAAHRAAHNDQIASITAMQQALSALRQELTVARNAYHRVGTVNLQMWP